MYLSYIFQLNFLVTNFMFRSSIVTVLNIHQARLKTLEKRTRPFKMAGINLPNKDNAAHKHESMVIDRL